MADPEPERIERNAGCRGRQKRSGPRGFPCCGPICERTTKGPNCSWESAEYAWCVNSYNYLRYGVVYHLQHDVSPKSIKSIREIKLHEDLDLCHICDEAS